MSERRYHHGNLRAALLAQAETTLRTSGVDGLSLRELAREVGVSYGSPRRHFEDKAALLDALVEVGLQRLGAELAEAVEPDGRDFAEVLTAVAISYIRFATDSPAMVDLMSRSRYLSQAPAALVEAREASFAPVRDLVERGQAGGELVSGDVRRVGTLIFATLHGLATLVNNGMIDPLDDRLIADAIRSLLAGIADTDSR
ncbi:MULTISPECIES: TetR/AcrR family transcriptional regulator [Nocardia]|uniref:TetR/AcrR family transcriptional regulator n=1 Tax=Nocardia TaxID=1817 RepID=UPI000D690D85|nr:MULTISPECIES: TetR/AcrR family transcriptional regulator [Nocardia]